MASLAVLARRVGYPARMHRLTTVPTSGLRQQALSTAGVRHVGAGEGGPSLVVSPRRATDEAEVLGRPGSKRAKAGGVPPVGALSPAATAPPLRQGTAGNGSSSGGGGGGGGASGGGQGRPGWNPRMPPAAAALGALSLVPIGFYVSQHAPLDTAAPPSADAWLARWLPALPFDAQCALSRDQATVRQRFLAYLGILTGAVGAVHWGFAAAAPIPATAHFVAGVVPALVAWAALCLPRDTLLPHALLSGTMFTLWLYEERLLSLGRIPAWYASLRTPQTFALLAATTLCFGLTKPRPAAGADAGAGASADAVPASPATALPPPPPQIK